MSKKLTYEFVKEYFKSQGCELISKEYVNALTLLDYICVCGNPHKIAYYSFKNGSRCKDCGKKKQISSMKYFYDYVKQFFKSQNCFLLSKEYTGSDQLLDYICKCVNTSKITFNNFQQGHRCMNCSGKMKHSYEFVYNYFKEQGCELLSKEYKNNNELLDYICSCGNKSKILFHAFKQGKRCNRCGLLKIGDAKRFKLEYVKDYFELQGCKLISNIYVNNYQLLDYICSCGNQSKIRFNDFKNGQRCSKCAESKGEKRIKEWLKLYNIYYDSQYTFDDLRGIGGGLLRFDVPIFENNEKTQIRMLIEFDGRQHFEWIEGWMTKEEFETLQYYDQLKNEYCMNHNIKLVRIPYWDFDNIEQILEQHLNPLKVVV